MGHMAEIIVSILLWTAALFTMVGTALSFVPSYQWWVRAWDFPRLQMAILGAVVIVATLVFGALAAPWLIGGTAIATLAQAYRIRPFTPAARSEILFAEGGGDDILCLSLNVEMSNDRHEDVARLIRDEAPDILLLMETDETWAEKLKDVLGTFETVETRLLDNYYGMIFATNLPLSYAHFTDFAGDRTPTLVAELTGPAGNRFRFVGVHPRPPVPGVDTEERDLEIMNAACIARDSDKPVVIMGDFNDAAWSNTAQVFKRAGEYFDVRVGRGFYASFHARRWWFRCPIDQFFVTEGVTVSDFRIGPAVGSDHFPVMACVGFDGKKARQLLRKSAALSPMERSEIDERLATYRRDAASATDGGDEQDGRDH